MAHLDEIKTVGVLGAGQMGSGIAQVAAGAGFDVVLVDATLDLADRGKKKIAAALARQVEKGKLTQQASTTLLSRVEPSAGVEDFRTCDYVIEAATENYELKVALLKKI